jgi:hypothetical protein
VAIRRGFGVVCGFGGRKGDRVDRPIRCKEAVDVLLCDLQVVTQADLGGVTDTSFEVLTCHGRFRTINLDERLGAPVFRPASNTSTRFLITAEMRDPLKTWLWSLATAAEASAAVLNLTNAIDGEMSEHSTVCLVETNPYARHAPERDRRLR